MISPTGNRRPTCTRGFALLEVIVAVVILFGGIVAVVRGYATAVAALGAAEDTLRSSALAAAHMTDVVRSIQQQRPWAHGGTSEDGYQWDVAVARLPSRPDQTSLSDLRVTVMRQGQAQGYTLVTLLHEDPTP